jgi:hypothetical protein
MGVAGVRKDEPFHLHFGRCYLKGAALTTV